MISYQGNAQYVAGEKHSVFLPRLYKADGTKRPIVWCHSAGGDALEPLLPANNAVPILRGITETLGLPVIAADLGGVVWGNDTAQTRVGQALAFLRTQFGAHATLNPILFGVSMGGLLSLNWARANPTLVRALALMYPVTNLQAMHDGSGGIVGNAAASTEAAYGGSTASFNAAVAAHNPVAHAAEYAGVPIKMWYSTNDTTVGTANQTDFIAGVGGNALESSAVGAAAHADMTKIPVAEMLDFVSRFM